MADINKQPPFVTYNSGRNEWYTPPAIIEAACNVMGSIDLDPASCHEANKIVKATKYYDIDDNGLNYGWEGNVWLNPPYARGLVKMFVDHLLLANFDQAIVLVNNSTETIWSQLLMERADTMCFVKGRISFLSSADDSGTYRKGLQGSVIYGLGIDQAKFLQEFRKFGAVLLNS